MTEIIGWTIALVLFLIWEAVTAGVVSIWFAGGAAAALVCAAAGTPLLVQVIVFLVASAALLLLLRPLVKKWIKPNETPTNADRIVGQEALVTETIDRLHNRGAVRIGAVEWSARSEDDSVIPEGSLVRVERIEGVFACVTLIEAVPEALSEEKAKAAFFKK